MTPSPLHTATQPRPLAHFHAWPTLRWPDPEHQGRLVLRWTEDSTLTSGSWLIRGGIACPRLTDGAYSGHAVVIGRCEAPGHGEIVVLADCPWVAVSHVMRPDGQGIEFEGIAQFLSEAWSGYVCNVWYAREHHETIRRATIEIHREPVLQPKPAIVAVEWDDDDDAMLLLRELDLRRRLWYQSQGSVYLALVEYSADKDADLGRYPILRALAAAAYGLTRRRPPEIRHG